MAEYLGKIRWASVSYMTKRQRWWFLSRHHEAAVSTADRDGVIFTSPCWYHVRDQRLLITFDQASRHVENTGAGGGITAAVYAGGDELCTPRGITIQGRLELVEDRALSEEVSYALADTVLGPDHPDYDDTYIEFREFYDHLVGELVVDRMITWDGRRAYSLQSYSKRRLAAGSEAVDQRRQRPEVITADDTARRPRWEFSRGCHTYVRVSSEMQGCQSGMQGWTEQAADMEPLTWRQASWDEIFYCVRGVIRLAAEDAKGARMELIAKAGESIYVPGGFVYTLLPSGVNTVNLWSAHPVAHRGLRVMRDVGFPDALEVSDRLRQMQRERRES